MSVTKIALRNLSRQKRRTFLLGGAIAFGVLVASLVNGFTGGLVVNIESNVSKMVAGHIFMSSLTKDDHKRVITTMDMTPAIEAAVKNLPYPVAFTQRRTRLLGTLVFETNSMGREVDGVDWKNDHFLMDDLKLKAGSTADLADPRSVLIGQKHADKLGIRVGEEMLIQTQTIHGQQNFDSFIVKAIFDDANNSMSSSVYIGLDAADKLADMKPGSFNLFGITLKNFSDTDKAVEAFVNLLPADLKIQPRSQTRGKSSDDLVSAFKKDKKAFGPLTIVTSVNDELAGIKGQILAVNALALLVLVILLTVVMVGLTNTYRIIVYERSREIGTMRAMGMQRNQVQRIFVLEAVFLSLGGALAGILLAVLVLSGLSLIPFGTDGNGALGFILNNGHLNWRLDVVTLVITTALVAGMTWIAALMPARRAGKVDPAVALRTTA
jgi:putative ABC transport system permease protein